MCFIICFSQKTAFLKTKVIPKQITKTFYKKWGNIFLTVLPLRRKKPKINWLGMTLLKYGKDEYEIIQNNYLFTLSLSSYLCRFWSTATLGNIWKNKCWQHIFACLYSCFCIFISLKCAVFRNKFTFALCLWSGHFTGVWITSRHNCESKLPAEESLGKPLRNRGVWSTSARVTPKRSIMELEVTLNIRT